MCKILSRIKTLAKAEGVSVGAIERSIGASRGVISRAIANGTDIQAKWLEIICKQYPKYSAQWLLTGEGNMLKSSTETNTPQSTENNGDPDKTGQTKLTRKLSHNNTNSTNPDQLDFNDEAFAQQPNDFNEIISKSRTPNSIPLVSVKAVGGFAGTDFAINEKDIEGYYVIPKFRNLNVDFLIEISGDSMMPHIFPGDIIACSIVHGSRFIQWNKPYLIATREDGMIVKRIKPSSQPDSILAVSDNAEYDPFDIPKSDIDGLARVVGVIHIE